MDAKVAMATQKTSALTTYNKSPLQFGFSLIEILVVLGLLAALAAFAIPRLNFKQGNLKTAMRQLSVLSRQTRHLARIKQSTYRIVLDLDSTPPKYWVEYTSQPFYPTHLDHRNQNGNPEDQESTINFTRDEQLLKSEKTLPPGIRISAVETQSSHDPYVSGFAYIYYWPTGLVDAAIIRLVDQNNKSLSIVIQPLTGRAEFFEQEIKITDILVE
jgi:prepilin-type N-terminal cleavage/methylation domain-containing protein